MSDHATRIHRLVEELNAALEAAWRDGLKVEAGFPRFKEAPDLKQVSIQVLQPLHPEPTMEAFEQWRRNGSRAAADQGARS